MCKHHTQPTMSIFVKSEMKVKSSPSLHRAHKLSMMGHSYSVLVTYHVQYTIQWLRSISYVLCITLILLYLVSEGANSFGNARWSSHFTVVKLGKGRGWSAGARDVEGGSLLCYALHTALFSSRLCLTLGRRGGLRGCLWSSTLASFFKVLSHSFISYLVLVHNLP